MNNEEKIIEMLGAVQSKMDNMEKTVNGLKEDVKKLKVNQKYMWEDIEKLDKHIGMVESDVRQIKEYVVIYNEAEDVPHFCKWGCNISEQTVSISPASLKRQLEDFAYGKI